MNDLRTRMFCFALMASPLMAVPVSAQTASNVVCSLCVNGSDLANNAVNSAKITDGAVKSDDLARDAVTNAHISSRAVTYNKLDVNLRRSLDGAISNVSTTAVEDSAVGVASADCPSSRIAVSASCLCDDNNENNNFGVLFACAVDGNGAVAACFDEAATFNPTKPSPVAIVQAICLGAETSDGDPWVPTAGGLPAQGAAPDGSASSPADEAAWYKAQHEVLEASLARLRQKQAAHRSRIQAR